MTERDLDHVDGAVLIVRGDVENKEWSHSIGMDFGQSGLEVPGGLRPVTRHWIRRQRPRTYVLYQLQTPHKSNELRHCAHSGIASPEP